MVRFYATNHSVENPNVLFGSSFFGPLRRPKELTSEFSGRIDKVDTSRKNKIKGKKTIINT